MEYVSGDDLYTLIKNKKKLPEIEAAYLLRGVATALEELHKFNLFFFHLSSEIA